MGRPRVVRVVGRKTQWHQEGAFLWGFRTAWFCGVYLPIGDNVTQSTWHFRTVSSKTLQLESWS
jgi:hypothetical protein